MVAGAVWPADAPALVQPAPAASPAAALQVECPLRYPQASPPTCRRPGRTAGCTSTERTAPGLQDNAAAEVEALSAADVQADRPGGRGYDSR